MFKDTKHESDVAVSKKKAACHTVEHVSLWNTFDRLSHTEAAQILFPALRSPGVSGWQRTLPTCARPPPYSQHRQPPPRYSSPEPCYGSPIGLSSSGGLLLATPSKGIPPGSRGRLHDPDPSSICPAPGLQRRLCFGLCCGFLLVPFVRHSSSLPGFLSWPPFFPPAILSVLLPPSRAFPSAFRLLSRSLLLWPAAEDYSWCCKFVVVQLSSRGSLQPILNLFSGGKFPRQFYSVYQFAGTVGPSPACWGFLPCRPPLTIYPRSDDFLQPTIMSGTWASPIWSGACVVFFSGVGVSGAIRPVTLPPP